MALVKYIKIYIKNYDYEKYEWEEGNSHKQTKTNKHTYIHYNNQCAFKIIKTNQSI